MLFYCWWCSYWWDDFEFWFFSSLEETPWSSCSWTSSISSVFLLFPRTYRSRPWILHLLSRTRFHQECRHFHFEETPSIFYSKIERESMLVSLSASRWYWPIEDCLWICTMAFDKWYFLSISNYFPPLETP